MDGPFAVFNKGVGQQAAVCGAGQMPRTRGNVFPKHARRKAEGTPFAVLPAVFDQSARTDQVGVADSVIRFPEEEVVDAAVELLVKHPGEPEG